MTFSRAQRRIAWTAFAALGVMLVCPPWLWYSPDGLESPRQWHAGHAFWWSPPLCLDHPDWVPGIHWGRLHLQLFVVAVGMLVLLFAREAAERSDRAAGSCHPPRGRS